MRHGVLVMARRVGGSRAYRICKRVFDIAFSVCVIAVGLGPGLILSAFIARDTGGSPIYTQERVGMGGRTFRIYKFRTMVADSDDVEKYLNSDQLAQWRLERKVDDDPRITPLGRKLRSTSVDEIPNFINVLKCKRLARIEGSRNVGKHSMRRADFRRSAYRSRLRGGPIRKRDACRDGAGERGSQCRLALSSVFRPPFRIGAYFAAGECGDRACSHEHADCKKYYAHHSFYLHGVHRGA